MDHVWSIVVQPDGTFMWLQSYENHYSLGEWMQLNDRRERRYLRYKELLKLLQKLRMLMSIDGWAPEANEAYLELFNVDVLKHDRNIEISHQIGRPKQQKS